MTRFLLVLTLILTAVVAIATLSSHYPGEIVIVFGEWRLSTNLLIFTLALLVLLLLAAAGIRLLQLLLNVPHRLRTRRKLREDEKTFRRFSDGLLSFISGDYAMANKRLLEAAAEISPPAQYVAYLFAAESAFRDGNRASAQEALTLARRVATFRDSAMAALEDRLNETAEESPPGGEVPHPHPEPPRLL